MAISRETKKGEVLYPKSAPVLQPAASKPPKYITKEGGLLDMSILPDALKGSQPVLTAPAALHAPDIIAASDVRMPAKEVVPSSPGNSTITNSEDPVKSWSLVLCDSRADFP